MRKERLLYILLGVLFVTYVVVEYYSPKPIDWTVTFAEKDKNPYGGFILYERMDDIFPEKSVSFHTLYESKDSSEHLLILTTNFDPSAADIEAMFNILDQGRTILIAAQVFSQGFLDALEIEMNFHALDVIAEDSVNIKMGNRDFYFPATFVTSSFGADTTGLWDVHAIADEPVIISKNYPQAKLILGTVPLAFTNFGLLKNNNSVLIEEALKNIPFGHVNFNRFYQAGKQEPSTPLRYVMSQAPLKWAVYLTILSLLLYLAIGSRRLQRAIPVLDPNKNTTLEFIKTIGGLYHREANHKNAAMKIINHFTKALAAKYYIHTINDTSYKILAAKSGVPLEEVIKTFDFIQGVKQSSRLSEGTLKQLYDKVNMFKIH